MPIKQEFIWTTIDERPFISIDKWVASLPAEEQEEFKLADIQQKEYRQQAINEGKMIFDKEQDVYIWKDAETERINKQHDPVWDHYWARWQSETGSICILKKTEI